MRTSSCKAKGRRLAQDIAELLYKYAPDLKPGDIRVTSSGSTGEDLLLSPAALAVYPLVNECKNREKLNIWEALQQAESHKKGTDPLPVAVVWFGRNRSKPFVALAAEDFIRLIR